jgi:hypothetical protein
MSIFASILILITVLFDSVTAETAANETTVINVKLNDRVLLTCNSTTTNLTAFNGDTNDTRLLLNKDFNWRLNLFKKDNLLLKLNVVDYDLLVGNKTDQGLYECGFYHLDNYASLNYKSLQKWVVKITPSKLIFNFFKYACYFKC